MSEEGATPTSETPTTTTPPLPTPTFTEALTAPATPAPAEPTPTPPPVKDPAAPPAPETETQRILRDAIAAMQSLHVRVTRLEQALHERGGFGL